MDLISFFFSTITPTISILFHFFKRVVNSSIEKLSDVVSRFGSRILPPLVLLPARNIHSLFLSFVRRSLKTNTIRRSSIHTFIPSSQIVPPLLQPDSFFFFFLYYLLLLYYYLKATINLFSSQFFSLVSI